MPHHHIYDLAPDGILPLHRLLGRLTPMSQMCRVGFVPKEGEWDTDDG